MAVTTVYTYPLDGTVRDFGVPFEYLARRFVTITLVGQARRELVITSEYRFTSKTSIQTTKAWGPADNYEFIEIRRNTSSTDRLVDFADGSILRAYELNIAQIQTMHIAEEARNMVVDTIGTDNNGDLDARGRRIVNLADATEPGHAVTLRQEQDWATSTLGNRTAAVNARVAAEAARDVSVTAKTASEAARDASVAAKTASETARDQSVAAAGTIGNNVTLSQEARSGAEAARDTAYRLLTLWQEQTYRVPLAMPCASYGRRWMSQVLNM